MFHTENLNDLIWPLAKNLHYFLHLSDQSVIIHSHFIIPILFIF